MTQDATKIRYATPETMMTRRSLLPLVSFFLLFLGIAVGEVVVLTDSTFEHQTQASTGQTTGKWFIKFYAPWCGHCKRMAGTWKELAADMETNHSDEGIVIAEVDSTQDREVTQRFGVTGYPSLKYIAGGKVYTYKGDRSLEDMKEFVLKRFAETEGEEVPPPESWVEKQRKKWHKFVNTNEALRSLPDDLDHIWRLRKNAAVLFILFGVVLGLIVGKLVGGSFSSKAPKKANIKKD